VGRAILGGPGFYDCASADAAHLRLELVDLYVSEQNFPANPHTGERAVSETTQKRAPGAALAMLADLDRRLTIARGPDHPLHAGILQVGEVYCPERGGPEWLCGRLEPRLRRIVELRSRGANAESLALAQLRLASFLAEQRRGSEATALLEQLIAGAPAGRARSQARLSVAMTLATVAPDRALVLIVDAGPDLRALAGDAYDLSTLAQGLATVAVQLQRHDAADRLLDAAATALAAQPSTCRAHACDRRWTLASFLKRRATIANERGDGARAAPLQARADELQRELDALAEAELRAAREALATEP
jgi:hypothetical protein